MVAEGKMGLRIAELWIERKSGRRKERRSVR